MKTVRCACGKRCDNSFGLTKIRCNECRRKFELMSYKGKRKPLDVALEIIGEMLRKKGIIK